MSAARQAKREPLPDEEAAVWIHMDDLIEWPDNPKPHEDVADIVDSIERFGFGDPLVARKANMMVLAGHGRLKAAKILRATLGTRLHQHPYLPVRLRDLSEREAHLYALTVNRLNEKSVYDPSKLLDVLGRYEPVEQEMAGWTGIDIAKLVQEVSPLFNPADEEDQGKLDELAPKLVTCPKCGHEWDQRKE